VTYNQTMLLMDFDSKRKFAKAPEQPSGHGHFMDRRALIGHATPIAQESSDNGMNKLLEELSEKLPALNLKKKVKSSNN